MFKKKSWKKIGIFTAVLILLISVSNSGSGIAAEDFRADSYYNLGVYYLKEGKEEEAEDLFKKAIEKDSSLIVAYGMLGNMELKRENYPEAVNYYQKILDRYPENKEALRNTAIIYFILGDMKTAENYLLKVLAVDSGDKIAREYLQRINSNSSSTGGEIVAKLKGKLDKDPGNIKLKADLGMAYIIEKQYEKALKILSEVVSESPDFYQAWNNLGIVYYNLGRISAAEQSFLKALKIAPDYKKARENLNQIRSGE